MKILVCGGREYSDLVKIFQVLDEYKDKITCLISGGARGADSAAAFWAQDRKVEKHIHPANWDLHGRAAGPIRNQHMLDVEKPDLVIAFPGGTGTADMIRKARNEGVEVRVVE